MNWEYIHEYIHLTILDTLVDRNAYSTICLNAYSKYVIHILYYAQLLQFFCFVVLYLIFFLFNYFAKYI